MQVHARENNLPVLPSPSPFSMAVPWDCLAGQSNISDSVFLKVWFSKKILNCFRLPLSPPFQQSPLRLVLSPPCSTIPWILSNMALSPPFSMILWILSNMALSFPCSMILWILSSVAVSLPCSMILLILSNSLLNDPMDSIQCVLSPPCSMILWILSNVALSPPYSTIQLMLSNVALSMAACAQGSWLRSWQRWLGGPLNNCLERSFLRALLANPPDVWAVRFSHSPVVT